MLRIESIQSREECRVIADLLGKTGHIRTVPIAAWVKSGAEKWMEASGITDGALFRSIDIEGPGMGNRHDPKGAVGDCDSRRLTSRDIPRLARHNLRRTCARLCHLAGGELDQIQHLPGHVSIQTTEQYLGCKQELHYAVNDKMGIEPLANNAGQRGG